ncbi:hypothetical protein IQ235_17255 [Oscillatoriales cyanobacterium LEGE 11467]|uniref:Uncharacterized protein n=1 Tax=Zarconia navalis LEGE 11467 TaxID=1828826 RepID=A0A928Z9C8_9CYAN|nr:hypothetical protein [Zarconia navalis]MBE9042520.1 hypothetical protein [Zarconia navalis LEGE 11467]
MGATNLQLGQVARLDSLHPSHSRGRLQPQEIIHRYLQDIVRDWVPEDVLCEFKNLFIHANTKRAEALQALQDIVRGNQEQHFISTIERSSYIILNYWELNGQAQFIPQLVQSFGDPTIKGSSVSPVLRRVRTWLKRFVASPAYQELMLFAARSRASETPDLPQGKWSDRYLAYKLAAQSLNVHKSGEQRELARVVAGKHKDHFKFALAKYVTRCQSVGYDDRTCPNPTIFGDSILRLMKTIVVKQQGMSSAKIAQMFVERSTGASYASFKTGLQQYLFGACQKQGWATQLTWEFSRKLNALYREKNTATVNESLRFRTCTRAIEWLTTENHREPSQLFHFLVSRGNPLTLAFVLLKLVFIDPHSHTHLERCIADLILYYEGLPEADCQEAIQFFEVFKILCAIYAEDVEYTLVKVKPGDANRAGSFNPNAYRLFARLKSDAATPASGKVREKASGKPC